LDFAKDKGDLARLRRPLPVACVNGLVFGSLHNPNGWPQATNATWFEIICALIAIRSGGIALTSGIHPVNNYFGAVGVVSGGDVFRDSPGPSFKMRRNCNGRTSAWRFLRRQFCLGCCKGCGFCQIAHGLNTVNHVFI